MIFAMLTVLTTALLLRPVVSVATEAPVPATPWFRCSRVGVCLFSAPGDGFVDDLRDRKEKAASGGEGSFGEESGLLVESSSRGVSSQAVCLELFHGIERADAAERIDLSTNKANTNIVLRNYPSLNDHPTIRKRHEVLVSQESDNQ